MIITATGFDVVTGAMARIDIEGCRKRKLAEDVKETRRQRSRNEIWGTDKLKIEKEATPINSLHATALLHSSNALTLSSR